MASSAYEKRIQAGMARYLAAHPNASAAEAKRAARGHGSTGEHGVTVTALGNNKYAVTFRDPAKAGQALRAAERLEGRVTVTAIGKDGQPINLFENKGHSKGFSSGEALQQAAKNAGGWARFMDAAMEKYEAVGGVSGDDDEGEYDEDDEAAEEELLAGIREYQLIVQ